MPQPPFAVPFGRQLRSTGTPRGTILSAALHFGLLTFIAWAGRTTFENAANSPGEGRGRGGGGGGGGNRTIAVWTVPVAEAQTPLVPTPPPIVVPEETPTTIPEPVAETPAVTPPPAPAPTGGAGEGAGTGPGTGPGAGTGTGGGEGSGTGPGIGADSGEGGGGRVFLPVAQGILMQPFPVPRDLRGTTIGVVFRISDRGEILDVRVDPQIRDRDYRNKFLQRMRSYTFTPARTRDGRAVPSEYRIELVL